MTDHRKKCLLHLCIYVALTAGVIFGTPYNVSTVILGIFPTPMFFRTIIYALFVIHVFYLAYKVDFWWEKEHDEHPKDSGGK